jgi:parvulin-like peptidyl-prolyl isomerase
MMIFWQHGARCRSAWSSGAGRRSAMVGLVALLGLGAAGCEPGAPGAPPPTSTAAPSPSPSASAAATANGVTAATTATPSAAQTVPDEIAAQHVLVAYRGAKRPPKTVTRSKAEAQKLAAQIASMAKAGENFSALVAQYSDDASNKDRMGSVGKFKRDGMVKPFSDAAFMLAVGETSGVVETEFGFHVIKRNQ